MIEIYKDLANVLAAFKIQFNQGFLEEQLCKKYSTDKFTFRGNYRHVVLVKSCDAAEVTKTLKACPDVTKIKTYPKHNDSQRFIKVLFKGVAFTFIDRNVMPSVNNVEYKDVFGERVFVSTHSATLFKLMLRALYTSTMDDALLPVLFELVAISSNTQLFQFYTKQANDGSVKLAKAIKEDSTRVDSIKLAHSAQVQIAELLDLYFVKFKNDPKNIVAMYLHLKKINWPTVLL